MKEEVNGAKAVVNRCSTARVEGCVMICTADSENMVEMEGKKEYRILEVPSRGEKWDGKGESRRYQMHISLTPQLCQGLVCSRFCSF